MSVSTVVLKYLPIKDVCDNKIEKNFARKSGESRQHQQQL